MSQVKIQATKVYYRTRDAKEQIIINRGGARSSKSYSLGQLFMTKFLSERNKKILIVRKTLPSLRISTLSLWKELLYTFNIHTKVREEKLMMNYYYGNNLVHFGSIDNPEKIKCHLKNTEILTSYGFKYVDEIKVGDLVASYNPVTKLVEYKPVTKTFEYDYDGDIYVPKKGTRDTHVSFAVTEEHKFIGKRRIRKGTRKNPYYEFTDNEFIKAKDIPSRLYVPRGGIWSGKIENFYRVPKIDDNCKKTTEFPIIPFLKFLGWYISEGCINPEHGYQIQICQKKELGRRQFLDDIRDFPSDYKIRIEPLRFVLSGKELCSYLESLGRYQHERRIPRDILELHPSLLWHIFDTLMKGDGHKHLSGRYVYATTSEGLKDDVCELALRLGLTPTVMEPRTDYPSNYPNSRKCWQISISNQTQVVVSKPDKEHYKGKVYCIEVPPYHTTLIRHNNKVMWIGQSSEWNYIWMEEATEFKYEDFQQLKLRLSHKSIDGNRNQLYLSFNPIDEFHWIKTKILDNASEDTREIHSTYRDNPYLSEDYITILEGLINQDMNFYRIYAEGEWGKLENLIYGQGWSTVSELEDGQVIYGLDFGFNAPTALIKCVIAEDGSVWEEELLYETGLTNTDLIKKLEKFIPNKDRAIIYADSAEPDRILEIKRAGFVKIKPADKSVKDGIDFVKTLPIRVLKSSENLIKEKRSYSWKINKMGETIDEPVEFMDHLMDAERYCLYTHLRKMKRAKLRWL